MTLATLISLLALLAFTVSALARASFLRLRSRPIPATGEPPPISVLKPVKGLEPGLEENLEALFVQDYPEFEVIVGAADPRDPALPIVQRVAARHPERRVVFASGAPELGLNPKVSNLAHLAARAQHPWLLISDANVRPLPGYLDALGREAAAGADLVHSPLRGDGGRGLGGVCEDLHLFGFVLSAVSLASGLAGHPTVIGKSMLFRREHLERVGGFTSVKDVLAEDYLLGRAFHEAGLRVVLSPQVLPTPTGPRSLAETWSRHLRWGQMRRQISPWSFAFEPLLSPLLFILTWGLHTPGVGPLLTLLAWVGLELLSARVLGQHRRPWRFLLLPIRDLLVHAIWLVAAFRTTVVWRGRRMTIGPGSGLVPCAPAAEDAQAEPLPLSPGPHF